MWGIFFSDFLRSFSWYLGNDQDENVLFQWRSNEKQSDILTFPHFVASLDTEINISLSVRFVGKPSVLVT